MAHRSQFVLSPQAPQSLGGTPLHTGLPAVHPSDSDLGSPNPLSTRWHSCCGGSNLKKLSSKSLQIRKIPSEKTASSFVSVPLEKLSHHLWWLAQHSD